VCGAVEYAEYVGLREPEVPVERDCGRFFAVAQIVALSNVRYDAEQRADLRGSICYPMQAAALRDVLNFCCEGEGHGDTCRLFEVLAFEPALKSADRSGYDTQIRGFGREIA
jgi:hypothetical protein